MPHPKGDGTVIGRDHDAAPFVPVDELAVRRLDECRRMLNAVARRFDAGQRAELVEMMRAEAGRDVLSTALRALAPVLDAGSQDRPPAAVEVERDEALRVFGLFDPDERLDVVSDLLGSIASTCRDPGAALLALVGWLLANTPRFELDVDWTASGADQR
jgi:hypothetical protein